MQRHLSKLIKAVIHATVRLTNDHSPLPVRSAIFVALKGSIDCLKFNKKHKLLQKADTTHTRSATAKAARLIFEDSENPSFMNTAILRLLPMNAAMWLSCRRNTRTNDIISNCVSLNNPIAT
ncbi:hypothetical protein PoB_006990400 [Plakobranchus ocellatus]|uniref:Uncharacterized protein n=1 Tax=Plakobranchus ocellatus TaxID=259542 RepID=A0AAV4DGM8_9GAST|nr:hypothetical protein PoB_006990400 [Plakobranchus ocellatus]